MKSEENIFLLTNENNYYLKMKYNDDEIIKSFYSTMNFYISFSIENMNIKDKDIYYAGLTVIKNIFKLILLYTKNLELTIFNCQQGVYYYVEYISQITDREDNIFFNLSIKDAVIYVYTRTIFEVKKKNMKKHDNDNYHDTFNKLDLISNNYLIIINNLSPLLFNSELSYIKDNLSKIADICLLKDISSNNIFNDIKKSNTCEELINYLNSK